MELLIPPINTMLKLLVILFVIKLYALINIFRVIIVSPDSDVAVISLYQSVTNLTFLDALWFKTGTGDDQKYIPIHVLASELVLTLYTY